MDKHKILKILYPTAGRIFLKYIKRIRVTDVNLFPEKTEVIYPECGKFYYYFPNLRLGSIQFLPSGNSYFLKSCKRGESPLLSLLRASQKYVTLPPPLLLFCSCVFCHCSQCALSLSFLCLFK